MDTQLLRKSLHDLNNALNAAKIHAFLLRQEDPNPEQAEALSGIDAALENARQIILKIHEQTPDKLKND
jgi:hypothetical protein